MSEYKVSKLPIRTLHELLGSKATLVKDSRDYYFSKDNGNWNVSYEDGTWGPEDRNESHMAFPVYEVTRIKLEERIAELENEVNDLKTRIAILETPKFDKWTTKDTRPYPPFQIFNKFIDDPKKAAEDIVSYLDKNYGGLKK